MRAQAEVTTAQDNITNVQNKVTEAQDKITSLEKDIAAQVQAIRQAEQAYQSVRNQADQLKSVRQSEILSEFNQRQEELTTVAGQLEVAKSSEK